MMIKVPGTLYFENAGTGEYEKLTDVNEMETVNVLNSKPDYGVRKLSVDSPLIISFDIHMSRNTCLSMMYGMKITNNWLKLHGGIMNRTSVRTRRKRKQKLRL